MTDYQINSAHDVVFSYTYWSTEDIHENTHNNYWWVLQQSDGRWAIKLDYPGGYLEPHSFAKLGELILQFNCIVKCTSRQQLLILVDDTVLEAFLEQLDIHRFVISRYAQGLGPITVCVGSNLCKHSSDRNNLQIARDLAKRFRNVILPGNFKIAISGCTEDCCSATSNCLGLIATSSGFQITLGGSQDNPGQLLITDCPEKSIPQIVEQILKGYIYYSEQYKLSHPENDTIRMHQLVNYYGVKVFQELLASATSNTPEIAPSEAMQPLQERPQKLRRSDFTHNICGFSKESAFYTFLAVEKACPQCQPCSKSKCQLYIAKSLLVDASRTGHKYNDHLPKDFMQMLQALPILDRGISHFYLQEAYQSALTNCDRCSVKDHFAFCSVNLNVLALGILLYGSQYHTDKDLEKLNSDEDTKKPED